MKHRRFRSTPSHRGLPADRGLPERDEPSGAAAAPDAREPSRTIALLGHRGSGKTTLAERLLELGRVIREAGSVDEGTTLFDFTPEARRHRMTLDLGAAWFEWRPGSADPSPVLALGAPDEPFVVQLLDTPGADALAAVRDVGLSAAETAVVTVDAGAGVEVGTDDAIAAAVRAGTAIVAVVTRADRAVPDVMAIADGVALAAGVRAVPLELPFVDEHGRFVGVIDVLAERVVRFAEDGSGASSPEPVPDFLGAEVAAARERVCDAVAMTDDRLLEEYLEYLTLPADKVAGALAEAVRQRRLVPVLLTSAEQRIGARALLDRLVAWTPAYGSVPRYVREHDGHRRPLEVAREAPFVAQVLSEHVDPSRGERFHLLRILAGELPRGDWVDGRSGATHRVRRLYRMRGPRRSTAPPPGPGAIVATYDPLAVPAGTTLTAGARVELELPETRPPMMALAVRPVDPRDEAAVADALQAIIRSDRGLSLLADTRSGQRLLAGADEAHLRLSVERVVAWSGAQVVAELPAVGYVEMPAALVRVEGVHVEKDGDGLVEAFGKCEITLVPTDPANGPDFVDGLGDEEDDVPLRYRGAIDEGAREALRHGPTAGYPVVGAEVRLTGGAYDILQSTDDHFRLAGERAARIALERAGTRLLEPWVEIEIHAPQAALGDVISDISAHRGRILGMQVDGPTARLVASSPYRELRTFASRLRTLTHGRGHYQTLRTQYEMLPDHLVAEAIQASPHRHVPTGAVAGRPASVPPVAALGGRR